MGKKRKQEEPKMFKLVGQSEPKSPKPQATAPKRPAMSYESWWMLTQKKYDFPLYMKEVLYKHFKARGFLSSSFDEGLKDFGIKS